jgi:hypothetical protein
MNRSDVDRMHAVRAWLAEGSTELSPRVFDTVLREIPATSQDRPHWASPRLAMSTMVLGVTAIGVAVLIVVGARLWTPSPPSGPGAGNTASPSMANEATATPDALGDPYGCAAFIPAVRPAPGDNTQWPTPPFNVGLIGFAAEGAAPSTPLSGELLHAYWVRGGDLPYRGMARLYADGRLIWNYANIPGEGGDLIGTGYVEQRLTPSGVEVVRQLDDLALKDPMVLNSCLPPGLWADPTFRPYVPAAYAACLGASNLEQTRGWEIGLETQLALLPAPVRELLEGRDLVPHGTGDRGGGRPDSFEGDPMPCLGLSPGDARALDAALRVAGFEQDSWASGPGTRYFFAVEQGLIHIMFEPVFPDGTVGSSYSG